MYLRVQKTLIQRNTCKGIYLFCGRDSYRVDSTAVEILQQCDGTKTEETVIHRVVKNYPDEKNMANDIQACIKAMKDSGIIISQAEPMPIIPIHSGKYPLSASFEVTHQCNLRCSFCIDDARTDVCQMRNELSWDEIEPVIEELGQLGAATITITGGEALLRPELVLKMSRKARDAGLKPILFTNATLVDHKMAQALLEAGIKEVQVSIDSLQAEQHDNSRGVAGAFARTMNGVAALNKAGMKISFAAVITKKNISQLEEIYRYFRSYGNYSRISEVLPLGRGIDHPDLLSPEEILKLHVYTATTDSGQLTARLIPRERCSIGNEAAINPYGEVYPCKPMSFSSFRLGNVRETTLTEMWKSSLVLKELQNWKIDDIEECNKCHNRLVCGGGCRAVAYVYHNSIFKPDTYRCKAACLFTEALLQHAENSTRTTLLDLLDLPPDVSA